MCEIQWNVVSKDPKYLILSFSLYSYLFPLFILRYTSYRLECYYFYPTCAYLHLPFLVVYFKTITISAFLYRTVPLQIHLRIA